MVGGRLEWRTAMRFHGTYQADVRSGSAEDGPLVSIAVALKLCGVPRGEDSHPCPRQILDLCGVIRETAYQPERKEPNEGARGGGGRAKEVWPGETDAKEGAPCDFAP
jgi:hypothetical protein